MIIAHINKTDKSIKLISVPRDTFFNGRKLNSAYWHYGADELKRELGIITGLYIDHYIIIDMYAFIEVIDLMGGVDVHLSKNLKDPTYKTFDNGEWGTLDYKKGEHHLSGVQVLRLARSRHTSSDFARARRQHAILAGIKDRIRLLNAGDSRRITQMAKVILNKTKTDISLRNAVSYIFKFRSFKLKTTGVLSTANVFKNETQISDKEDSSPWKINKKEEKCYRQLPTKKVIEIKCAPKFKGQYILVPKKDWNTVRWYVHQLIR